MSTIEDFKDKNGNLTKNWKQKISKVGEPILDVRNDYPIDIRLKLAIIGKHELDKCPVCAKEVSIGTVFCSRSCSAKDSSVTAKKIASTDIITKSIKISNALKGNGEYVKKSWETRKHKYGNSGFSESGMLKIKEFDRNTEKAKETCIIKYGVDNASKSKEVKDILREYQLNNKNSRQHLPEWVFDKELFSNRYNEIGFNGIIDEIKCSRDFLYRLTYDYNLRNKSFSSAEDEIKSFIESYGFKCILRSRKIIPPLEIDIFVPDINLAIEYNGIYWHSSGSIDTDDIKNNHLNKTNLCEDKNIHLLHIFENEWISKNDIWKSVICHKLGKSKKIFARKCIMSEISLKTANEFCEDNHLQGGCGASFAYGLFYENDLVQVATFGKPRYTKTNKLELIRLCSKKFTCVVGGASRLLNGLDLISYANRRWSFGNVYEMIGMKKVSYTPPSYYYIDSGVLKHRSSFMKHKLINMKGYDDSKTESQICYENGLRRIWDCGNILYETTKREAK